MKVPVDGSGVPAEITPVAGNLRGASWSEDGTIVFATAALDTGLFRVAATGGPAEPLTVPDGTAREADHLWPHVLPDGKHVLFVISRQTPDIAGGRWDVAALDVSTKKWRVLRADASYPIYVAPGHLLFSSSTGLSAVRFDPVTITVQGDSQVLAADALFKASTGAADVGVSSTGTLVYVAGGSDDMKTLVWTDRQGKVTTIPAPARAYLSGRLSPDGDRVAMVLNERGMSGIWIYDFARTTMMRLTPDGFPAYGPVWSESGRDLYFAGLPASGVGLFSMPASGTGQPALVATATDGRYEPFSIRRGSPEILVELLRGTGVRTTFLMNPGPPASPTPLGLGVNDAQPSLSPDGRWLAYVSEESGRRPGLPAAVPGCRGGSDRDLHARRAIAAMVEDRRVVFSGTRRRRVGDQGRRRSQTRRSAHPVATAARDGAPGDQFRREPGWSARARPGQPGTDRRDERAARRDQLVRRIAEEVRRTMMTLHRRDVLRGFGRAGGGDGVRPSRRRIGGGGWRRGTGDRVFRASPTS